MGVYIKGMEMPKSFKDIRIYADGRIVSKSLYKYGEEIATAFPVPPHGRLIDADKQDAQIETLIERYLHGYTKSTWDFVCKLRYILKRNPTIIPAKEGET